MEKDIVSKILNYYECLPGTIKYNTKSYIGFKVCGTMYSEVSEKKEYLSILVRRKYVTNEEINKLNISLNNLEKWTLDTEIRIKLDEKDITPYLNIIKRAYDKTVDDYDKKVSNIIEKCIEEEKENVFKYSNDDIYAFEKLRIKFNEFNDYKISNSHLDELNSDFQSLNKFNSSNFLENYINHSEKYNFIKLIYEIVSYVDVNAFDKINYNEYEDKRTLALTFVRQNDWVRNLISYKKYNDLSKVTEVVRNTILYITTPSKRISIFKNLKISKFLNFVMPDFKIENNYEDLCDAVFKYLDRLNIEIKNKENRGIIYGRLIFAKSLNKEWDIENYYWKIQPFNNKELAKDKIRNYLKDGVIVSKDTSLRRSANNNIFYVVDEDNKLFLGYFIEEAEKMEGDFYKRKFKKLKDINGDLINLLPIDKSWGNKYSTKTFINIKLEERRDFEEKVINKLFNEDIDSLIEEIKKIKTNKEEDNLIEEEIIYSKDIDTPLNLILYGPPGTGKTYNTINYAVSIIEKKEIDEVVNEAKKNREEVFSRYKNYLAHKKIVFTTFHQNYSYEEFIQGIRANTNNTDTLSFSKEDGIFKDLVERAKVDTENNYVIIIDEINRGNISRIFGELITLIEDDKRLGMENETKVTLPSKEIFGVPSNLFIIGTMNTADKSIALIDLALRRRFDFIAMYPDYTVIPDFEHILRPINKAIYDKKKNADYLLGHAFFINKTKEDLENIMNKKIIPLLNEYFFGNEYEIKDVLSKGGIRTEINMDTFQLEYKELEE